MRLSNCSTSIERIKLLSSLLGVWLFLRLASLGGFGIMVVLLDELLDIEI